MPLPDTAAACVRLPAQTFPGYAPGEVTPEQAHEAGVEFARRLLGDKYEAVVCTHTDRDHLHCHIVFNSVSFMDGKKYRSDFKSYFHDLRGISNEVSRERGYSVIEPDGKGASYASWNAEKRGSGTIRDLIRRDIDAALAGSLTYDTFLETLRRQGYSVKRSPNVKHTAVRPPGGQRFVRVESLGLGYHIFKQAAGKTAKSILVSAAVRLASFTLPEIQRITASDDMELGKLGERKQAIFCIIPDSNDASLNFLVGMLYTQAFQELYYQADKIHQGALPVPVRLMFDEFANVALPDGYARLQATMRSRNIMSTIILQNISQLKALFKDDWEGIIGNADSFVYLGGNEQSTHKYISELLGKETIDTRTSSQSKGRNGSFSQNFQQTGRELMTPDEVRRLDNKNAIVLIRGEKPVIDEKYDILKHPNIHRTEDGGAPPYLHTPLRAFAADDLSFPIENIDDIEFLED